MTREQTIEAIRVMQAFADGNEVQFKWGSMEWNNTDKPEWNWDAYNYRIKPTAKLRPWTADEVPLGAWMRHKESNNDRFLITHTRDEYDRILWLSEYEHSTDGGKTWKPCGVEESK